jgi:hypothetical protein
MTPRRAAGAGAVAQAALRPERGCAVGPGTCAVTDQKRRVEMNMNRAVARAAAADDPQPTSSGRTLGQQMGDSAAANPPAGAQTTRGESFKRFFGIP